MGGESGDLEDLLDRLRDATRSFDAGAVEQLARALATLIRDNLATKPDRLVAALRTAVVAFDRERASELCEQLTRHVRTSDKPYPLAESKSTLGLLRRKRYFDLVLSVADALIQTGQDSPNIRRQYAQALLDTGRLSAGHAVLTGLIDHCLEANNETELAEARGLVGRAHKQAYMDAAAVGEPGPVVEALLRKAIRAYGSEYERNPGLVWHGINAVALLLRARRDGVELDAPQPDATAIASSIIADVEKRQAEAPARIAAGEWPNFGCWDLATAAEACLALGDFDQALRWTVQYAEREDADAFEFASTLRQFQDVWTLDGTGGTSAKILHLLRSVLLSREGGSIDIASPAAELSAVRALEADRGYEKVLGTERFKTFRWYHTGYERAAGVAQIVDRMGNGQGTGFLVASADLPVRVDAEWVLLTNAHVLSEDPAEQRGDPRALPPDKVRVRFEAGPKPDEELEVEELLYSSLRTELDCTIATLRSPKSIAERFPIATVLPLVDDDQRVYVIGHPGGGRLSYSLDDNILLGHDAPHVHYRAPTEGGSSGSPVFNEDWDLIALHHAGSTKMKRLRGEEGTYPANEGIYIQSILADVQAKLG